MPGGLNLGDVFPDFTADSTHGPIHFHDWIGDSWAILFSHPADYTPVCTSELGQMAKNAHEFEKRGVKLIALSCDDVDTHKGWIKDIKAFAKVEGEFPFPILSDKSRELAVKLGMLDADMKDDEGMPLTCRALFIIKDKRLKLSILYPATTGRSIDEILRVVESLRVTSEKPIATPAGWKRGQPCMVQPYVKDEELKEYFPEGVTHVELPSGKNYLRMT